MERFTELAIIAQSLLVCVVFIRLLAVNLTHQIWRLLNRKNKKVLAIDTLYTAFPEIDELKAKESLVITTFGGLRVNVSKIGNAGE
ncbi:hypothetical protein ICE59_003671 [Salmonella enterica subsp. enterica serovar Agama]|nr:hypothetical protein [Salmonella enterica subsp. enterica serovar Agama]EHS8055437.1 hypothetical protein [Salmonella enterica subsp. enterica]EHS8059992.1 hypothetical protein [Salmonella enterica subsp. enterica]